MKIQYTSDLHLEFTANSQFLFNNPIEPIGDVLILAGDIGYLGEDNYSSHPFWDYVSENFKEVLVVPGNHEFYQGYNLASLADGGSGEIRKNVRWYYNSVVTIENVDFILSTFWSYIEPTRSYWVERGVNDFRLIVNGERTLSALDFNAEHQRCVDFVKSSLLTSKAEKRVVVTHHLPSQQCVAPQHKCSMIGGAFASEQYDMIHDNNIDYWIYGHSHTNVGDIEIGKCKLLSNQLGYVSHGENSTYTSSAVINL